MFVNLLQSNKKKVIQYKLILTFTIMCKKKSVLCTKLLSLLIFSFFSSVIFSQNNAIIQGKIVNEKSVGLSSVSISILGKEIKTTSNDLGYFTISIPSNTAVALVFSYIGYTSFQKNFNVLPNSIHTIQVQLNIKNHELNEVVITDERLRQESGRINLDANKAILNPSPLGNIESLIKIFVGSNNELTSQYSVRGGSYDENLVYVNDFEVFRPYLVRSGQQEGLSFINPELTESVKFYNGGFQAKYGDKMSSVLDITYKKPKTSSGSAYIGLLEQGLHLEAVSTNKKWSYLLGFRNRSNRNLLSSQATKGNYIPSSSDLQTLITYQPTKNWLLELLVNNSTTKFTLYPEESKLSSAVFSPLFTANLGLDIYFEGQEKDEYKTNFTGFSATLSPNKNLKLKWMASRFNNREQENIDITGAYSFGERDFDKTQATYGLIVNPLGAGIFQNYARNNLDIEILHFTHKGSLTKANHFIQWGTSFEWQKIKDKLHEWEYTDSAGYSLPYSPTILQLNKVIKTTSNLSIVRLSGFVQDNIQFKKNNNLTLQVGLRYNYNSFNKEFLVSPRMSMSLKPKNWKKDVILKASVGAYHQPPFYRELRRYDGSINNNVVAQKSWQITAGLDYNLKMFERPARISSELFYKSMNQVVAYDIDNVRLRYLGENNATAFATGGEIRLFGELVKDAESWISIGFLKTKEDLKNDFYYQYKNASGEFITSKSNDQVAVDSVKNDVGFIRRPTDRLITFGMFFQDYLSTNKNIKMYLNTLYGSNLPYNIPNSVKYRNVLVIEPYLRIDMGLSALLLNKNNAKTRSKSPFKNFESVWVSLEIFNLIDKANTISYLLIKDFANNTFTLPNRLTPRLLNLKLVAKW